MSSDNSTNGTLIDSGDDYDHLWFVYYWPYTVFAEYLLNIMFPMVFTAFGLVGNIVIIIIYYRQGALRDSCTTSMIALAVADFCNCLVRFLRSTMGAHYTLIYQGTTKMVLPHVMNPLIVAWFIAKPQRMLTNIGCSILAYIGLERMICVTFPFHVKRIFTPIRTCMVLGFIYVACFLLQIPMLISIRITSYNRSSNGLVYITNAWSGLMSYSFFLDFFFANDVFLVSACLCLIVLFNSVIIFKVKVASTFRKSTASGAPTTSQTPNQSEEGNISTKASENTMSKEDKLTRMMVVVSIFLVLCMMPNYANTLIYRQITKGDKSAYHETVVTQVLECLHRTTEAMNSSCNIIFYYIMSAKFKKEFLQLCSRKATKK